MLLMDSKISLLFILLFEFISILAILSVITVVAFENMSSKSVFDISQLVS